MGVLTRRRLLAAAGGLAGAWALAGCTGVAGSGKSPPGTVRYSFWGGNSRQTNYRKAFEQAAGALTGVTLNVEATDYNPYRERMTTQIVARDVADVFWVPSPDVLTYQVNDLFRRVDDIPTLDLSDFSEKDLQDWRLRGDLNTIPFGIHVPAVFYNRTFAEEDGVELPENPTWSDMAEFARDYTANNPHGRRALGYAVGHDQSLQNWLRQNGEQLWTEDGRVGFSVDNLAGWIDWWEQLRKAGATTSISEQDGVDGSWEDIGDRVLVLFSNANHAIENSATFPDFEFGLKHPPIAPDAAAGFRFIYTPRMGIYARIDDANVEPAGQVVSYCINNTDMLRAVGLTMGTPVNPRIAREYEQYATPIEREMLAIGEADRAADRTPAYESPPGAGEWRVTLWRVVEDVINSGTSPTAAVQQLVDELNRSIDRAS